MVKRWPAAVVALLALAAIGVALSELIGATLGLVVETIDIAGTPATLYRQAQAASAPAVVIAHGFAGSRELMQPFAVTLARNGYVAITFDFLGHGKNPHALRGSITKAKGATTALVDQLGTIVAYAKTAPGSDGRVALLGHSMASDIVVRYAMAHPEVAATIAVSMFAPGLTATSPRDLLVIVGALEPQILKDQGLHAVAMAAKGRVDPGVTYGSMKDGTARRISFSAGVEHIGVLYSPDSMAEALAWLDAVFDRKGSGYLEVRGRWIGLLFVGLVVLARPLFGLLPPVASRPLGAGLGWRWLLPVSIAPAILTPLILWKAPIHVLPLLLGDYLAAHFLVYGIITGLGLWFVEKRSLTAKQGFILSSPHSEGRHGRRLEPRGLREAKSSDRPVLRDVLNAPQVEATAWSQSMGIRTGISIPRFAFAVIVLATYSILAFGLPIDWFVASFWPIPRRVPLILAMMVGTLPYFLADEWLTRGTEAPRGAYAFTKLCFLLSLAAAVALNLEKLFFLIIIAIVILLFFVVYGLFSAWTYRATRHPLVGGLSNALAFAWAVAVTFPLLAT